MSVSNPDYEFSESKRNPLPRTGRLARGAAAQPPIPRRSLGPHRGRAAHADLDRLHARTRHTRRWRADACGRARRVDGPRAGARTRRRGARGDRRRLCARARRALDATAVKNLLLTLCIIAAVCALSFGVFYTVSREPAELRQALHDGDAMAWLRAESQLNDTQFAAIKKLHEDYRVGRAHV